MKKFVPDKKDLKGLNKSSKFLLDLLSGSWYTCIVA